MPETDPSRGVETSQEFSRRILDLAYGDSLPLSLLSDSLALIAKATGCNVARLVIREQDRRFSVTIQTENRGELALRHSRQETGLSAVGRWTTTGFDDLEKLCQKVYHAQIDPELPWFTPFGSLRIDDINAYPGHKLSPVDSGATDALHLSPNCRSTLIVPVDGARHRLGLLQLESATVGFFSLRLTEHSERLAQALGFTFDLGNLQATTRKRSRELSCLYEIMRLVADDESSLDEVLQRLVELIPSGWSHPDHAAARIVLNRRNFETRGAEQIVQRQSVDILVDDSRVGTVEVGYTADMPPSDDGPFLHEERDLLEAIAGEITFAVKQRGFAEERQNLQVQLHHADRLATIGQLAAGVAHELNEPLSSIMGFAQLASKNSGLPPEVTRDLDKIVAAAKHARGIIRELLVFAREAKPVKVTFSLNELIRDGLFFLESRFDKAGINLVCDLDPDLPRITADRSQLLQVLTNLVVNSVQAMPDGGRLTIRTSHRDSQVLLVIEDTGCGMDEQTLKDIFHPFFTTKDIDQGTGLGLSVFHGIVVSHDGRIDVTSQPGEGTRFCIQLPTTDANASENQTRAE